jgi:hypothetical protein
MESDENNAKRDWGRAMTDTFLATIERATKCGMSVGQIEKQYGFQNRTIRRARAELYRRGLLPTPGYGPRKPNEQHHF